MSFGIKPDQQSSLLCGKTKMLYQNVKSNASLFSLYTCCINIERDICAYCNNQRTTLLFCIALSVQENNLQRQELSLCLGSARQKINVFTSPILNAPNWIDFFAKTVTVRCRNVCCKSHKQNLSSYVKPQGLNNFLLVNKMLLREAYLYYLVLIGAKDLK